MHTSRIIVLTRQEKKLDNIDKTRQDKCVLAGWQDRTVPLQINASTRWLNCHGSSNTWAHKVWQEKTGTILTKKEKNRILVMSSRLRRQAQTEALLHKDHLNIRFPYQNEIFLNQNEVFPYQNKIIFSRICKPSTLVAFSV